MTSTPKTTKPRLIAITSLPLVLLAAYGANAFYQAKLDQEAFTQRIQGMGEYELCQLAENEFSMEMVEDMGCLTGNYVLQ